MTSGIPNYSDTPLWNAAEFNKPETNWTKAQLIDFAYPKGKFSPPRKSNYFYTNTGYILSDLIIEKASGKSFENLIKNNLLKATDLKNTFYPLPTLNPETKKRLAAGYNYNQYDNPKLVGSNNSNVNLSWAGAAGGIISNSEDIIKWVKALFIENTILNSKQKKQLQDIVSLTDGKPIKTTSEDNPKGFGLGIIQAYNKEIGTFWYYQGETLGFRALYMYVPCNNVIVSSLFNSATNSENDNANILMINTYKNILELNPILKCKS